MIVQMTRHSQHKDDDRPDPKEQDGDVIGTWTVDLDDKDIIDLIAQFSVYNFSAFRTFRYDFFRDNEQNITRVHLKLLCQECAEVMVPVTNSFCVQYQFASLVPYNTVTIEDIKKVVKVYPPFTDDFIPLEQPRKR